MIKLPSVPAFRKKKQQKQQAELEKRAEAFKAEMAEVVKKHGLDFTCVLIAGDRGIFPKMQIIEVSRLKEE